MRKNNLAWNGNGTNKLIDSYNGEWCIRLTAEHFWWPVKEKYLKRRRPYPTTYALKIRDELHDKMKATIGSAVKKIIPDSLVVFENVECNCGNCIEHPSITS